ncbi:UrvD/REP family ATP-dependent DNA helicase [Brachybacterium phenoliresistens]|uniref:UrvD/REP family ATP-dependent DNA helicase n=1 Tax=Brachybacterium phenoliresistens TaxID=396014 RepID=UPI0004B822F4|nr:UrvD/REP family ATP-dependent DNA helicase [Brachybacterium phenoliresistens]
MGRGADSRAERRVQLLDPDLSHLPRPLEPGQADPVQAEALGILRSGGSAAVHGAPGSGRTALALSAALEAGERAASTRADAPPVLLLSPRRGTAAPLRDAVALAGAAGRVRVSTPAALAFSLVRADALSRGRGEPSLVTGAEQDALLGELIAVHEPWHLELDAATRALPGFRTELRELITRAGELGLGPSELEDLGVRRDRPAWRDAAALLRAYREVLSLEAAMALDAGPRLDSGDIVRSAAQILHEAPASALVVDDAQDLTAAGVALVRRLHELGVPVLATACPDLAVDTFRGSVPDAASRLGLEQALVLTARRRGPRSALRAADDLRARLPLAGAPVELRRRAVLAGRGADGIEAAAGTGIEDRSVSVLRAADALEEARMIAGVLRDLHHEAGTPYDEMAVVCRSGGLVDEVAELLQRQDLPVSTATRLRPLREESVVMDLLRIVEVGASGRRVDGREAMALLRGPFGDADALRLRRIRRLLLDAHRARADAPPAGPADGAPDEGAGDPVASIDLLADAVMGEDVPGLPAPDARDRAAAPVHRLRRMIAAVRALGPEAAATDALWAAWSAAGVAEGWRTAALGADGDADEARSRLTAHRLDAVTALFAAVDRFTDRRPQADALVFLDHVRDQAIAEDTLAPRAEPRGRVAVLTPAQLVGHERDVVVLARVQEGTWPNTRLRSTLLGASELALEIGREERLEPAALRALQREIVIADEIRLAVAALTRAREKVLVTAIDGGDSSASPLVDAIERAAGPGWADPERLAADPGPAPDARRLVAALRGDLLGEDPAAAQRAAALLARLAEHRVDGVDPGRWYHQAPSTQEALVDPGAPLLLSPSALERAADCPRAWLLERSGGTPEAGPAQAIGTGVHALAQQHPAGVPEEDVPDLLARLHRMLAPMRLEETWSGRRRLRQADDAVATLRSYLAAAGEPLATEAPFTVRLGDVVLRGAIDRIEGTPRAARVVDLKTGRQAKTAAKAEQDLQLAAYQAALRDGALDETLGGRPQVAGASLVYIGTPSAKPAVRDQRALSEAEDPAWFDETVAAVSAELRGARVQARRCSHCDRCTVRRSCPLWPEGAEL